MMDRATENDTDGKDIWVDVVSHEAVEPGRSKDRSFYAGHMYHFNSLVNKQTFDEDPELWVPTAHASETSAHLSAIGEPQ